jgi:hypothetical protein
MNVKNTISRACAGFIYRGIKNYRDCLLKLHLLGYVHFDLHLFIYDVFILILSHRQTYVRGNIYECKHIYTGGH